MGTKHYAAQVIRQVGTTAVDYPTTAGDPGETCPGDSGGAVLVTLGGKQYIAGVIDTGNCGMAGHPTGSDGQATRVDVNFAWILDQLPQGAIAALYNHLGGTRSSLGLPVGDEEPGSAFGLRYNNFQHGAIVWTPAYGAFESQGYLRDIWGGTGFERGPLGAPRSNPTLSGDTWYQNFMYGQARAVWANNRWTCSWGPYSNPVAHIVGC
jgi:uncharacterized protein with LGFP repeats